MTTVADFTTPELIVARLHGQDAPSVIRELSQTLEREKRVPDLLPFYRAALNREFVMATDWETGMAFPHARLPALKELSFALGRSEAPLGWKADGPRSVRLVFLIAVPENDSMRYLSLIAGLARLAKEKRVVETLLSAKDAVEIFEVLQQIKLRRSATSANTAASGKQAFETQ